MIEALALAGASFVAGAIIGFLVGQEAELRLMRIGPFSYKRAGALAMIELWRWRWVRLGSSGWRYIPDREDETNVPMP